MELEELKNKILPTLERYEVKRAAVFGSFVRGEQTEKSDVDILVEFKGEKKPPRPRRIKNRARRNPKPKSRRLNLQFVASTS